MRHCCECAVKFSPVGKITETACDQNFQVVGGGGGAGMVDGWGALRNLSQNNLKRGGDG